ncbi:MAG TPA: glycosyltransferase family 2 protein [Patescibacteria group bacterium]|nr:glycosyltransferase family 2 protein [Patescibacteria group bacterium]
MLNTKEKNNIKLSIIIVNWNVKPLVHRCIGSIFKNLKNINFEIIVIDNNSQDGSKDLLKKLNKERQRLKIILNNKNIGFAAANNMGLKKAEGEFILFLNPDTEVRPNSVKKMIKKLESNKDIGLIGPKMISVSGKTQSSVRKFPSVLSQAIIFLKLHHIFTKLPVLKNYFQSDFNYDKEAEVEQVMGAAMMTKKDILKRVGYWDESYFLWFEDIDLCKKIKDAGWKVIYTPEAEVFHHGGESFDQVFSLKKQRIYNKSAIYYFKKHFYLNKYWLLLVLNPISIFISFFIQIFNISSKYEPPTNT